MDRIKFIWQDALIVVALALHFGALLSTNFIIGTMENIGVAAQAIEMDPVMRWALNFYYIQFILISVVYGLILVVYNYTRNAMLTGKVHGFYLNSIVFIIFYIYARDFIIDFGIVLRLAQELGWL